MDMAPRLAPQLALQLNSVGWPVWLLCTSVSVGIFSAVALFLFVRLQHTEERRRREQLEQQCYAVMWSFPEKEDKAARFRRWAEVLRFKPREARPPIPSDGSPLDVKVALEVFYREAEAAGLGPPAPEAGEGGPGEGTRLLRERVQERILQFLIECGPPKGLCAIKEEDKSIPSTPRAQHHAVDMGKLVEAASACSTPSASPSTPRGLARAQTSPRPPPALALDGEPVLRTENGDAVTRELLWAVLARIHAEASAASAQAAGQHQPHPSPSSDKLTQPLLGEWRNPLQEDQTH